MCKDVIVIGSGGHGKVVADIVMKSGDNFVGFLDDNSNKKVVMGFPILGGIEEIERYKDKYFIIAIGDNKIRKSIAEKYKYVNYYTAIHPSAIIGYAARIGIGTCVMANAVINAETTVGNHCIINTSAVIEHDNIIDDFVHISPNGTLCGGVTVGEMTHIGAGVTVKQGISVCGNCVIGAGAVVVKEIKKSGVYVGIPALKKM